MSFVAKNALEPSRRYLSNATSPTFWFRVSLGEGVIPMYFMAKITHKTCITYRAVACRAIASSCSRSVSSSSNHIWKDCAGPGLGYWRCEISYGWNLTTFSSRYRKLAPLFASARDAAGTLPGLWRAANRMEVTWINYVTSYNPDSHTQMWLLTPPPGQLRSAKPTVKRGTIHRIVRLG